MKNDQSFEPFEEHERIEREQNGDENHLYPDNSEKEYENSNEPNSRQNTNPTDEKPTDELTPSLTPISQIFPELQNLSIYDETNSNEYQIDEYPQNIDNNNGIINENNENQNVIINHNDNNEMNYEMNNDMNNEMNNEMNYDMNYDMNNDMNNDVNNDVINDVINSVNNDFNNDIINSVNNDDNNDVINGTINDVINEDNNDVINDVINDDNNDVINDVINDDNNDVINGINNDVINGINNHVINDNNNDVINDVINRANNDVNNDDNNDNITVLGRRRERNDNKKHDKFSDDNSRRKVKGLIIDCLFHFINEKISNLYNNKIGNGICIKQFKKLNKKKINSTNIKFNQEFLHKPIKEIFSEISDGLTNCLKNHNSNLIKSLINETDYNKSNYFQNLFNLTFLQCLNHIIGTEIHQVLSGIPNMSQILDQLSKDEDEDYINHLKYYFLHYEDILIGKKSRKPRH